MCLTAMVRSVLRSLHSWFRPTLAAFFYPNIPLHLRWRLLVLQPITLLTYAIGSFPYLFFRPFTQEYLPIAPSQSIRAIVFKSTTGHGKGRALRPLHLEIHGGAFIGGLPEVAAYYYDRVARETGAVVVSITYRYAPEHPFPAAIDDVDATIRWMQQNAAVRWGADPELMTVGGSSAGGNLAMAATQQPNCHGSSPTAFKGITTFFAVMELRLSPAQKPRPESMPKKDVLALLFPLFDAYAAPARANHFEDPRLSPVLADRKTLPKRILLIVPAIDILLAEQMQFAHRVNAEDQAEGKRPRVEVFLEKKGFHGYTEGRLFVSSLASTIR